MSSSNISKISKSLPYNFLAERLVLGSILTNPEAIFLVSQKLNTESFYLKAHQIIYTAMLVLSGEEKNIDYITVATWLQDNRFTEYIEDLSNVVDFVNQVSAVGYLDDYINLIQDKYLRRLFIDLGYGIIESGYATGIPLDELFSKTEQKLLALGEKKEKKEFSRSKEILEQIVDEIKQRLESGHLPGLTSSFRDLDSITQGFHKSDFIIIAGRPSMGKTAFSLALAKNIAKKFDIGIAFFSLEMTKKQLLYRLLSTESLIPHGKLRSGRLSQEEWIQMNEGVDNLSSLSFYIDDSANITVPELHFKIKKLQQEYDKPIGLIFIDYLQLLEDREKRDNRVQELSKITRSLKKLARDLNLPIVALSQLSRNVETRANKRPLLSDLRESGSIEQDADMVIMLYRDEYYHANSVEKNIIELIVAKQRNGPTGVAKIKFDPQYLFFENIL